MFTLCGQCCLISNVQQKYGERDSAKSNGVRVAAKLVIKDFLDVMSGWKCNDRPYLHMISLFKLCVGSLGKEGTCGGPFLILFDLTDSHMMD